MNAKQRKAIRDTVKKIHADMESDRALRAAVKENHIRVLADRGLNLDQIVAAHDMKWCQGGSSTTPCTQALSLA